MTRLRIGFVAVLAVAASALAGCATAPTVSTAASASPSAAAGSSPAPTCSAAENAAATTSYTPQPTSTYVTQTLKPRNFLVVGVSADTRLLGAVDPKDPNNFTGFDIDMVREVAKRIWPEDAANPDKHLRFKVINAAQRIGQLQTPVNKDDIAAGGVDVVARAFTITCSRWKQGIAFSAEYLEAKQKILVPASSKATSVKDIDPGAKVCAPNGSTSLDTIKKSFPQFEAVGVANHTDCLALFQQGKVAAITGDDAILAGFQAQDPNTTKVLADAFGDAQPYGFGLPKDRKDFVAFVNYVLQDLRKTGRWQEIYNAWLSKPLGAPNDFTLAFGTPVGS